MTFASDFALRHELETLHEADPAAFEAALIQTAIAGAALPRPTDKADGPATVFRLTPTKG